MRQNISHVRHAANEPAIARTQSILHRMLFASGVMVLVVASVLAVNRITMPAVNPPLRAAASKQSPHADVSVTSWNSFVAENFAGDQACATCHEKEYSAHLRSGHSRTLVRMNESSLAKRLADEESYRDPARDQTFQFQFSGEQLLVRDPTHAANVSIPVTWLLGSGTHAQTPIAVDEHTQSGVELRWSYFPGTDRISLTPDHQQYEHFEPGTISCFGRPMDQEDIRSCLGCHSTVTPPPTLPIRHDLVVTNVGCERCHGPRKKHVELAHQGEAEKAKPMVTYQSAEAYLKACSDCHRNESNVHPDATPNELARFQPYGIQRSRCYLESSGELTCSTCHDPHDAVSHDRTRSIDQCKQCHTVGHASECSNDAQGDCITCHMPLVPWTAGIAFHDHWIRIRSDRSPESEH